jgi:hypothetical protein
MSIWSRISKALGFISPEPQPVAEHEFRERHHEPPEAQYWDSRLSRNVWDRITAEIPSHQEAEFARLFQAGWVSPSPATDERVHARSEFFDLLERDAIDIDIFPWAEWREWYEES